MSGVRVLSVNAVYGAGSTGVIVRDIHNKLLENGIESYVAYSTSPISQVKNGYVIGGVFGKKVHALLSRINGKQGYFSRSATGRFIKYIKDIRPDIVHLHNLHSNFINLNMLLRFLGDNDIPTVVTLHDCWFFTGGCFHYTAVGCRGFIESCGGCPKKRSDTPAYFLDCSRKILKDRKKYFGNIKNLTAVGVSDWIAGEAKRALFSSVRTIHNGIDTELFKERASGFRERYSLKGKFVILGPASKWLSDVNSEGFSRLCEEFSGDDESIVLFGCPGGKELPRNVIGIPFTRDMEKLSEIYSAADVFANSTREDSLPTVNLEAQSCGTPVVTYRNTGASETVDGECGFSVETGDIDGMISLIRQVKENGKAHYSDRCRKWIEENFEREKNYQKYIDLYMEIAEKA